MVQSKTLKLSLMNCDLLLKNGVVIDGSGKPRYRADVAIKDGKIAVKNAFRKARPNLPALK